jgi:beta-lactamase regulating signal transducer with metallopeptidase domain
MTPITSALVWTLVHSLWQFFVIALLMSIALRWSEHKSASWRYSIALSSLLLALVVSLETFVFYLEKSKVTVDTSTQTLAWNQVVEISEPINFQTSIMQYIEQHQQAIFLSWILGVMILLCRSIWSIYYIHRLKRTSILPEDHLYQELYKKIAQFFGVTRTIYVREHMRVNSPMLVGFLQPMILFPISVLNSLSSREVEAILAHEIAHYIRKDTWVNLLQVMIETLFYYHPGIWWISANIRLERENVCDDIAMQYVGNPILYAKTLVKLQEQKNIDHHPVLAMAFNHNNYFSNRIKRILNMTQNRQNVKEKIWISMILLAAMFLFSRDVVAHQVNTVVSTMIDPTEAVINNDTLPTQKSKSTMSIQKLENGKSIKMQVEDGKIVDLKIDGKEIAPEDFDQYKDVTSDIIIRKSDDAFSNGSMFMFGDGGPGRIKMLGLDSMIDIHKMMQENMKHFKHFNFDKDFGNIGDMMIKINPGELSNGSNMQGWNFDFDDKMWKQMNDSIFGKGQFSFDSLTNSIKGNFHFDHGDMGNIQLFDGENWGDMGGNQFDYTFPSRDNGEKNYSDILGNALNSDGLLIPGQENTVELTGKHLKINSEKQPQNIYNKYRSIFEDESGLTLDKKSRIIFKIQGKRSKRTYRVY